MMQNGTSLRQAVTGGNNTAGQFQNLDNAYGAQSCIHWGHALLLCYQPMPQLSQTEKVALDCMLM